jgi:hypothetical protein
LFGHADGTAITGRETSVTGPSHRRVIQVGDVIRIPEAHYLYGVGVLTMRVTAEADLDRHPGLEWIRLRGVQIRWDGSDGDNRDVLVRVAALLARPEFVTRAAIDAS